MVKGSADAFLGDKDLLKWAGALTAVGTRSGDAHGDTLGETSKIRSAVFSLNLPPYRNGSLKREVYQGISVVPIACVD